MSGHLGLVEPIEVQPGGHPARHVLHIMHAQLVEVSQEPRQVVKSYSLDDTIFSNAFPFTIARRGGGHGTEVVF